MNGDKVTKTLHKTPPRTRAVIYARTNRASASRSVKDQCDVARAYASGHDIEIVRVYADIAKSGSTLGGMHAMQRLLKDMSSPARDFDIVLVYDLSRCGRFQSADENAYFDYTYLAAGIKIQICGDRSPDDTCATSSISKCAGGLATEFFDKC